MVDFDAMTEGGLSATDDFDSFLNDQGSFRKGKYFKWRGKSGDAQADVVLHTKIAPKKTHRHQLLRVVELKEGELVTGTDIWGDAYNCLEDEKVIVAQRFRNKLTKQRDTPPTICPVCLFWEYVFQLVVTGKLHWLAPVLKYDSDKETRVVRATPMWGIPKSLNDAQKIELRKYGVDPRQAWRDNVLAKAQWIFSLVSLKNPENGVQIAQETSLLGDRVRDMIKKQMAAEEDGTEKGKFRGHPMHNPYVIRFQYRDQEGLQFDKKYDAMALPKMPIPEDVRMLIASDPPRAEVERCLQHPNLARMRTNLENACVLKDVPWDNIFGPAERLYAVNNWSTNDAAADNISDDEPETPVPALPAALKAAGDLGFAKDRSVVKISTPPMPTAQTTTDDEIVACDVCSNEMSIKADACPHCGHNYAAPPPPPTKPVRKRSSAVVAPPATVAAPPVAQRPAPKVTAPAIPAVMPTRPTTTDPEDLFPDPLAEGSNDVPF